MMKRFLALCLSLGLVFLFGCKSQEEISRTAVTSGYGVRDVIYNEAQEAEKNILSVQGSAAFYRRAELAELCFLLEAEGTAVKEAEAALSKKTELFQELLLEARIPEEEIRMETLLLFPLEEEGSPEDGTEGESAYGARVRIWIRSRNLSDLELMLQKLSLEGFPYTELSYSLADPEAAYREALALAVEDALKKAESMAEAAGGKLGKVPLSLREEKLLPETAETTKTTGELPRIRVTATVEAEFELIER